MTPTTRNFDQALSEIGLFRAISDAERAAIARRCAWRRIDPHSQVIGHLDRSSEVYFVVQGRLRAINFSLTGKEISFRDVVPGEMFGEYAAIDGGPRSANVYSLEESFIGALSGEAFRNFLAQHPAVALEMMQRLTRQIRSMTDRIFEFSTLAVNSRIDAEILRLALTAGVSGNRAKIAPTPTHAEIAGRVATHREAVTRELNDLARTGIVEKSGRTLIVADFGALQNRVTTALGEFVPVTQ